MSLEEKRKVGPALGKNAPGTVAEIRDLLGEEVWETFESPTQAGKEIKAWGLEWGLLRVVGRTSDNHLVYEVL